MPPLTPEQLAYVVTHGELLSLLSLQRLEAMLGAGTDTPAPSADELAAAEAATLAELARQQQQWMSGEATPDGEASFAAPADALSTAGVDLGPEIDAALARAYADIPARARALQGIDTARLAPALAALPEALPPLTAPLDAAGMSAWLDLHDAGDPALERLMAEAGELAESAG